MPDNTGGQFPSLDGYPEDEVAQRTEAPTDGLWFRHVFTVHNRAHTVGLPEDHDIHLANHVAVLQRALQQGLHPKAQPELESEEPCPSDPVNHTNLTYRVPVVPAVADDHPLTTVTPSHPYGDPDLVWGSVYGEHDIPSSGVEDEEPPVGGGVGADGETTPLQEGPVSDEPRTPVEVPLGETGVISSDDTAEVETSALTEG